MLEESPQELFGGQTDPPDLLTLVVPVAKGDLAVVQGLQTRLADGDAEDVASQILQDFVSAAGVPGVDDPGLMPCRGQTVYLPVLPLATPRFLWQD
jgi:hypothetical protein